MTTDAEKRERAWTRMRRSHLRHAVLRVERHIEWLRARVRACEEQLELDRRRHAELAAEDRQQRELAKALRTIYGAPARGRR